MKIRMLTAICGADINASHGDTIDIDKADGDRLVAAGMAEVVASPAKKKPAAKK